MITNIIEIELLPADRVVTRPVHQWDIGQIIKVTDAEIEDGTPVDFGNRFMKGGLRAYVINNQVTIPAPALQQERDLTGYMVVTDENSETTVKEIAIPVIARPKPEDYVDEEVRESTEFQYVILTAAEVEANARAAVEAAGKAAGSETAAADAKQAAENAATAAAGSATSADASAKAAASSEQTASGAATTATDKATEAGDNATASAASAAEAKTSETNAAASETAAKTSEDNAKASEANAAASEQTAKEAAETAKAAIVGVSEAITAANEAKTAATSAAGSATAAGKSATAADTSAKNAEASKTAAGNSATAAGNSATAAGKSATNAANSEAAAKTAAGTAETKAQEATNSATDALNSKTAAGKSETNAGNSAKAAADSEAAAKEAKEDAEKAKDAVEEMANTFYTPTKVSQLENDCEYITGQAIADMATEDYVDAEILAIRAEGLQQVPLFANSIEECTDTTKLYVLPDGFLYAYMAEETEGSTVPNFTNVLDGATINLNKRISSSGSLKDANGYIAVQNIAVSTDDVVRFNDEYVFADQAKGGGIYSRIKYYDGSTLKNPSGGDTNAHLDTKLTIADGITSFVVGRNMSTTTSGDYSSSIAHVTSMAFNAYISSSAITESDIADLIMTINEEITYTTTDGGTKYTWKNTGRALTPAEYEKIINELKKRVDNLEATVAQNETEIANLKENGGSGSTLLAEMEVFAPSPQLPADGSETADFNADSDIIVAGDIYDYLEPLLAKYPRYITKEVLGKDESGTYDWCRYVLCRRAYDAWLKPNYPKMYAWVNGSTIIYSVSVSPRIGDAMYSTAYIGTVYAAVTAVDNPNQTRTVNGLVFSRDSSKDVEPTLVYTLTKYSPYFNTVQNNGVYNSGKTKISTIAAYSANGMTDAAGNSYTRYPLGDRSSSFEEIPAIVIGSNEHGTGGDPAEPAIISARMMKDLCECANADNPFLNLLKNDYKMVFCPIINPWGFSAPNKSYYNSNGVNLDRNFDTAGWGSAANSDSGNQGDYGGSENETQYFMNTLVESGAKIAMANHALGEGINSSTGESTNAGHCHWMLGRNNSKYTNHLASIGEVMSVNYNLAFSDYGQALPETYAKTRSYIDWIGAEGGAVEMNAREGFIRAGEGQLHTARILEADYTLLLQFLHMLLVCQE